MIDEQYTCRTTAEECYVISIQVNVHNAISTVAGESNTITAPLDKGGDLRPCAPYHHRITSLYRKLYHYERTRTSEQLIIIIQSNLDK